MYVILVGYLELVENVQSLLGAYVVRIVIMKIIV